MFANHAYMGFGYLFYEKEDFIQAARCFNTVIVMREAIVDENSVLLANPLNNFACCLLGLNKKEKAIDYLRISLCIYEMCLELHDEYVLTVKRNIDCALNQPMYIQPHYQASWLLYYKDEYEGIGKGGIHQIRKVVKKQ